MAEQAELDLPATTSSAPISPAAKRRAVFAGLTRWQMVGGLLLLLALVWGMWVTKTVTAQCEHIVSVRLSDLVGEYVEAQRYSASPPEKVKAEMQAFMASLDKELQRRSANGQIVLVGEAVLSKNVDDITETLKNAVYASGVPVPRRATVEELQQLGAMQAPQVPPTGQMPASPGTIPSPTGAPASPGPQMVPGATVSSFGGPDVDGGQ